MILEHRDRDVIHPGGTSVGGDLSERRIQGAFGMDLVDQAEPLASFDPLFEGRQHPLRPDRRFDPAPAERDLSGTCSPRGHCLRLVFASVRSSRLHLPAPLRSTGVTRLRRYYGCSDSWTPGSSAPHGGMNTGFGVIQVSLRLVIESSDHSVSNHLPSSRRVSGVFCVGLTGPRCRGHPSGAVRHLGFAIP